MVGLTLSNSWYITGLLCQQDLWASMSLPPEVPSLPELPSVDELDLTNLRTARQRHNNYICPVCMKEFRKKVDFSRHYIIHTGEKPFPCYYCPLKFQRKERLKIHVATAHPSYISFKGSNNL